MSDTLIVILASLAIVLFGALFIFLGRIIKKRILAHRKNCTSMTTGWVTEMEERRIGTGEDKSYTWYPHYEFFVEGEKVEAVGFTGVYKNSLKVGQHVTICYNPENPAQVYAKEEPGTSSFNIFGIVGWIFFISGIITFIVGMILVG